MKTATPPPYSLGSLALREASHHVLRTFKQSYGEAYVVTNWGLLLTASTTLPAIWVRFLRSRNLQLTIWLQPHKRPWDRTTQKIHTFLTDRDCEISVIIFFEVIHYAATINTRYTYRFTWSEIGISLYHISSLYNESFKMIIGNKWRF